MTQTAAGGRLCCAVPRRTAAALRTGLYTGLIQVGNHHYGASVRRRYPVLVALDHVQRTMAPGTVCCFTDDPFGKRLDLVDAG